MATGRATGRATGLTEDIVAAAAKIADEGEHPGLMPHALRIPARTFRHWLKRGADTQSAGEQGYESDIYVRLLAAIQQGEANFEKRLRESVVLAARNDWKAALTVLERRFPQRWGKALAVRPDGEQALAVVIDAIRDGDEEMALRLSSAIQQIIGGDGNAENS